jgi:hypothetical protein
MTPYKMQSDGLALSGEKKTIALMIISNEKN